MFNWFRHDPQVEMRKKRYPCYFCKELFKHTDLRITHAFREGSDNMRYSVWACTVNCENEGVSI